MQYCRHRKMMRGITSTYTKMSRRSFVQEEFGPGVVCLGGVLFGRR